MDQDGSLFISFNEWRDFLLLAPSDNIHDLIKYWRHSTVSLIFSQAYHLLSSELKFEFVWPAIYLPLNFKTSDKITCWYSTMTSTALLRKFLTLEIPLKTAMKSFVTSRVVRVKLQTSSKQLISPASQREKFLRLYCGKSRTYRLAWCMWDLRSTSRQRKEKRRLVICHRPTWSHKSEHLS